MTMVGIKSRFWKLSEIQLVVDKYRNTPTIELARQLGRTEMAIISMASRHGVSKVKKESGEFDHGLDKTEKVLKLIKMLHESPCVISDIEDGLGVINRTAYRYISLLISSGIKIEKEGKQYFISRKNCPICGHTTNNPLQ
jgi:hypothetical protein